MIKYKQRQPVWVSVINFRFLQHCLTLWTLGSSAAEVPVLEFHID